MRVADLMTTDVITVGPDATLKEAARRMLEGRLSGLPVTDNSGKLVGIITEADFVSGEADRRRERAGLLRLLVREETIPSHERKVSEVMTSDVVIISPEADHAEAARQMERRRVKRLPVLDDGRLVGMISRSDLLRAFTRPDEDIVSEITDGVLTKVLWIDPARVKVTSDDGHVTLEGSLETRTDAELLLELTKRLDGVASVKDSLSWEVDNTKVDVVSPVRGVPHRRSW